MTNIQRLADKGRKKSEMGSIIDRKEIRSGKRLIADKEELVYLKALGNRKDLEIVIHYKH